MEETDIVIQQIRTFNRFYTGLIGLLNKHVLNSEYSLAEARILYEIYVGKSIQASQIMMAMHIDKSYLSRLLKKLEKEHLLIKKLSEHDARAYLLTLTEKGREVFFELNGASDRQINELIGCLPIEKQQALVGHMQSIMSLLQNQSE